MDIYSLQILINKIIREISGFYHSPTFLFVKILIGIYVVILIADIVLMVIQRGFYANIRQMRFGMDMPSELVASNKDKTKERWNKIKKRLESENASEYKVAIIEADAIIDDLIKRMGYKGADMSERLASIPEGQLGELTELKDAHEIRNRVIHEDDFKVDKDFAEVVLKKYEHLLKHFQVLD